MSMRGQQKEEEALDRRALRCLNCGLKLSVDEIASAREECERCIKARKWDEYCQSKSDPYDEAHGYDR